MVPEEPREEVDLGAAQLIDVKSKPAAIHNFGGSETEVWARLSYATGPSCQRGEAILDKPIKLVHWMLHEVPIKRKDGSIGRAVRTVLVDDGDRYWGFMSDGVYNSLRLMISSLGVGPYSPPVDIVVRKQQTAGNNRFYSIEPAPVRESRKGVSSK